LQTCICLHIYCPLWYYIHQMARQKLPHLLVVKNNTKTWNNNDKRNSHQCYIHLEVHYLLSPNNHSNGYNIAWSHHNGFKWSQCTGRWSWHGTMNLSSSLCQFFCQIDHCRSPHRVTSPPMR
jgi:hypothetical protein